MVDETQSATATPNATQLLSQADRERVQAAVRQAELRGAGEIVVAIIARSEGYAEWRAYGAITLALCLTLALHLAVPELSTAWVLAAELPLILAAWLFCGVRPILMALTPDEVERAAVRRQAAQIFLERALFETKQRTGVLVLVSMLEHHVEILADRGIHERVGTSGWQRYVDEIITAARAGRLADGLCSAVAAIGDEIARAFPPTDAGNELSDSVVERP